jgi:hypothetical protein
MSRIGTWLILLMLLGVLGVIVGGAMGVILMFMSPSTTVPRLTMNPDLVVAIGQFLGISLASVLLLMALAASGGDPA